MLNRHLPEIAASILNLKLDSPLFFVEHPFH
jgi:hypothetical protein